MIYSHCKSSPGSHNECRTAPDGCRPLDQADRDLSRKPAFRQQRHIHHRHLLLLSPKAGTHFTILRRVEG